MLFKAAVASIENLLTSLSGRMGFSQALPKGVLLLKILQRTRKKSFPVLWKFSLSAVCIIIHDVTGEIHLGDVNFFPVFRSFIRVS